MRLAFGALLLPFALVAQKPTVQARDLPLTWIAPTATPVGTVAVFLSGDGGWAELVRVVSATLASRGIGVVGLNARSYLSPAKTPDETAAAMAVAARAALDRYHGSKVLLLGYSRGADIVPFVGNRLPADVRDKLAGIVMFGMAPAASFEFHWSDLVKDTPRSTDIPTLPELLKLRGVPMACVFGVEEKSSGCRDAPDDLLTKEQRPGAHHFDGDPVALANVVLRLIGVAPVTTSR